MYVWSDVIEFSPDVRKLITMNLHGLMHTWLLGVTQQMIPPFSMFQDRMELYHFTRVRYKYNDKNKTTKILEREYKINGRW